MAKINIGEIYNKNFYYNNLFYDYIFNFGKLDTFYNYDYRKIDNFKKKALKIEKNYSSKNREKILKILKNYNLEFDCGNETIKNIEKLNKDNSVIITGGHQPIIFTGPLFLLYKVLTIIKLSYFIEKNLNIPAIPCFWNASDDSNVSAINKIKLLDKKIKEMKLPLREDKRFSELYYGKTQILEFIEKIDAYLYDTDFKKKIIDFFHASLKIYNKKEKVSLSNFFSYFLLQLFKDFGIVIIDPEIKELKEMSLDEIRHDINDFKNINELIMESGENLEKLGYHAQLNINKTNLNIFVSKEGKREKVRYENDFYQLKEEKYNKEQLINYAERNIGNISLNVVLRPIFQDRILPVLASICGPGEVSYFSQLKKVYEVMGIDMPIIYPRLSATIIEKKVKKAFKNLDIDYNSMNLSREEMVKKILHNESGNKINKEVSKLESQLIENIENSEKNLSSEKIKFSTAFDRIKRNIKKEVKVLKGKLYSDYKKKNKHIENDINKIYLNIFPGNNMQEREINIFSYINKYDFSIIDNIYNNLNIFDFSHKFIEIR